MIKALPVAEYPDWLAAIDQDTVRNELFPIKKVLQDSLYYPSAGLDGRPVQYLGGHIYSFIYVDYGYERNVVSEQIANNGFKGYRMLVCRDITKHELTPNGWQPVMPKDTDGNPMYSRDWIKPPFCIWAIMEREPDFPEEHGPLRFSLLYLCADGAAAFQALYLANHAVPKAIAIIQPGDAFGWNWTSFTNPNTILGRSVLDNPNGQPKWLMYGGVGWPQWYRKPCWPQYQKNIWTHGNLGLWEKPTVTDN